MKWSAEMAGSLGAEITAIYAVGRTYHPAQMATSSGYGGFAELLMGSVAHHVSHHARVPVVVVPSSAAPEVHTSPELQLFSSEADTT